MNHPSEFAQRPLPHPRSVNFYIGTDDLVVIYVQVKRTMDFGELSFVLKRPQYKIITNKLKSRNSEDRESKIDLGEIGDE